MKEYSTPICMHCRNFKAIAKGRNLEIEYVDITENTKNLKEFLYIRDHNPIFKEVKEEGCIGIPYFVDGNRSTFDVDEALSWMGQEKVREEEIVEKED